MPLEVSGVCVGRWTLRGRGWPQWTGFRGRSLLQTARFTSQCSPSSNKSCHVRHLIICFFFFNSEGCCSELWYHRTLLHITACRTDLSTSWQRTSRGAGSSVKPGRCTTNVTATSPTCRRGAEEERLSSERRHLRPCPPPLTRPTTAACLRPGRSHPGDGTPSAQRLWIGSKVRSASATAFSTSASPWCRHTCWRSSTCWASLATACKACQRSRTPVKVRTWRPP